MTTEPEEAAAAGDYPHPVRAAVLRIVGEPMVVETIHLKAVGPEDVRVRIDQTGVCHSDLSLARGVLQQPVPAVLGHEACGTIVEPSESRSSISTWGSASSCCGSPRAGTASIAHRENRTCAATDPGAQRCPMR